MLLGRPLVGRSGQRAADTPSGQRFRRTMAHLLGRPAAAVSSEPPPKSQRTGSTGSAVLLAPVSFTTPAASEPAPQPATRRARGVAAMTPKSRRNVMARLEKEIFRVCFNSADAAKVCGTALILLC
jgi:hypothetical protein